MKYVWHDANRARSEFQSLVTKNETGFTKVNQQAVKQAGLSGYDTKARSNKGLGYAYTRILLDGDTIYILIVESLPGQDEVLQRPIRTFFDSFSTDRREH